MISEIEHVPGREKGAEMQKWEYWTMEVSLPSVPLTSKQQKIRDDFVHKLNKAGADGWELVQSMSLGATARITNLLFFKRQIP